MTRPTPLEAFEMKCARIIKEIWEGDILRSKDELISIRFEPDVIREPHFINVRTKEKMIQIHKSSFENYFNSNSAEQRQHCRDKIKSDLEILIYLPLH